MVINVSSKIQVFTSAWVASHIGMGSVDLMGNAANKDRDTLTLQPYQVVALKRVGRNSTKPIR
ncbi:MAG: hypothetical protein RBR15_07700 [Sphaerochaeta sp.]|nr:hypothetical protein [Sphaerochaeta sp.]